MSTRRSATSEKDRYPDDEWDSGFATVLFVKRPG
ncbi:hypothetical protein ACVILI_001292 [Mesorhizobium sp. USDA 4775]